MKTQNRIGFNLGAMYHLQLNERFAIAPQTIISFQNSELNYDLENLAPHTETIQPTTLIFPIHLVFSNDKKGKFKSSVLLGGRYTYDISKKETATKLNLNRSGFSIDLGTGLTIRLKKVNIKPELIYSLGLTNLKPKLTEGLYHSAIKSIHRDKISFRLIVSN